MNKKNSSVKRILALITVAAAVAVFLMLQPPKGYKYLLPEGYQGWGCVHFEVPGAEPLVEENGYHIIKLSNDGVLKTSSSIKPSEKQDLGYYFYNQNGERLAQELISGGSYDQKPGNPGSAVSYFWVTTAENFEKHKKQTEAKALHVKPECGLFLSERENNK